MQSSVILVLACLVAAVVARAHYEQYPAVDAVHMADDQAAYETIYDTPAHERSQRTKRGLFLLKKKLLLGALGLKAVKIGAVGAGVLALKKKTSVPIPTASVDAFAHQTHYGYNSQGPSWNVEVHSWH